MPTHRPGNGLASKCLACPRDGFTFAKLPPGVALPNILHLCVFRRSFHWLLRSYKISSQCREPGALLTRLQPSGFRTLSRYATRISVASTSRQQHSDDDRQYRR